MGIYETFDSSTKEILKPSNIAEKIEGFPEIVVVVFGQRMLNVLLDGNSTEIISNMIAGINIPIYKTEYKGKSIAFYMTTTGAPATVGLLEEIIVKGGKKILIFGSCGSLKKDITDGHIIVPDSAFRDEGTSYHYASAETGDFIEIKTAYRLAEILDELNIPIVKGKTWTTDAIYRETQKNMELRKKAGCITVEMECASIMALAAFRNIDIYQFLYTADNLDCEKWEPRLLGNMPDNLREQYVRIALEVAIRL